jgi:Domain of unknown function (DUF4426)
MKSASQYFPLFFALIVTITGLTSFAVHAQNVNELSPPEGTHTTGDYDIHYSTFNSQFITADIAQVYGLVRAKNQTLLNISVQKKSASKSMPATVQGTVKNLMQQVKTIEFKTIDEPGAIYYIGALRHDNEETVHIDLSITPDGESTPITFRLTRKLYTEN